MLLMPLLFISIFILSATITSSVLFLGLNPQKSTPEKITNTTTIISPTKVQTVYGLALSPTEIITPNPSITQAIPTPLPTVYVTPTLSPSVIQKTASPMIKKPTPTNTPMPTNTPKPTSTPRPTATPTQKPLPTTTPTLTPFPTALLISTPVKGLNATVLFELVNDYRHENGLPSLQKDDTTCSIAQRRAQEVYDEIFVTDNMHAGLTKMKLPYWITENIIYYNSEQGAFNWWIQDYIHRRVILGNYKYSCTACFGYSCSQVFTSYIPK